MRPATTLRLGHLAICALLLGCAGARKAPVVTAGEPASSPPAGIAIRQAPQFVVLGSDDNGASGLEGSGASGGLHLLTTLLANRRNPAGTGTAATFGGSPGHFSFYVNTYYVEPGEHEAAYGAPVREDPVWVKRAWREALAAGHEIGVHTHSHPHGRDFTALQWEDEMRRCVDILRLPYAADEIPGAPRPGSGLGLARSDLAGFRTPYLEYGDATMAAAAAMGFVYDCSLEEGTQPDQDGSNFVWPYRLDHGSPANPEIGNHPGLWEVPVYVFVVPPDEACERFGVPPGLRAALKARRDYFDVVAGKITGMDWNLWCEFGMTKEEFLATIFYTLELRLAGNRCPLTIGLHSELYSDRQQDADCPAPLAERRAALAALVDHLFTRSEVRVVTARDLVRWLEHPVPLGTP